MTKRDLDMHTILDIPLWEKVQDQIAKLTGTAIICIDYKGIPVTKHSERTDFCSVIRENPVSRKRCYRCDALAALEAVRLGRPYIYLCHCGIVDVAVPVKVGDKYLGAVMFGQVRLANIDAHTKVERLVNEISSFQEEEMAVRRDLMEKYERLPEMEYDRIVAIAQMMEALVCYIVDRSMNSRNQKETYQWLLGRLDKDNTVQEIQEIQDMDFSKSFTLDSVSVSKSSVIYPAVAYIHCHPEHKVTMAEMAALCHLSPSYFSRVFSRELGENFVTYVNRQKVTFAKQMLRETDKSITQVAAEVGYQDASHFIKLFKRFEGITPQVYRQYEYK